MLVVPPVPALCLCSPVLLCVRDVLRSTQTLAFLVPLLAALAPDDGLRVIIATPSQELAVQIAAEAQRLHDRAGERSLVLLAISSTRETELEQQARVAWSSIGHACRV